GISSGDSDYIFGMGPGPELLGPDNVIHPHIGWVVAVTKPSQTENDKVGRAFGKPRTIHYQDSKVYAKFAWRDFLVNKYHSIQALNSAWGSRYTTFDSDGGWPNGKGLLDESGRNPW